MELNEGTNKQGTEEANSVPLSGVMVNGNANVLLPPASTTASRSPSRNPSIADQEQPNDENDELVPNNVIASTDNQIPEAFNVYRNMKTLTQGLMDLALFSSNANQLRFILDNGNTGAYFYISILLISLSLIIQLAVGLLLLMSTRYNVAVECQRAMAYKFGNYVVMGIFLITVLNIFITAFGGPTTAATAAVS